MEFWFSVFCDVLNALTFGTVWAVLLSGVDDLFLDLCFWSHELGRVLLRRGQRPVVSVAEICARPERHLAILVPAWREAGVIAAMAKNTLRTLEYDKYIVFLGTYRNDPATTHLAEALAAQHPGQIVRAHVDRDGPTCKADCLNWILRAVSDYESAHGLQFAGLVLHDCEDVVHPLELKYFNSQLDTADLIQLPVMSLELPWHAWVAATYLDDFSEVHQKDLAVRQRLTGVVPGAGVALCYSRRAVAAMAQRYGEQSFNVGSLTEDYDFSYRLAALGGMTQVFASQPIAHSAGQVVDWWRRPATATGLLATCAYFPAQFRAAYRQRARWVLGIAFLGWRQLGWRDGLWHNYMLLRDRKGVVTAPLSMATCLVLISALAVTFAQHAGWTGGSAAYLALFSPSMQPLLLINLALLANRVAQRVWFVSRAHGLQHGLLAIPRLVCANFINFAAVMRAWHLWISHLATGTAIAWDKTDHVFPQVATMARHRRRLGELLVERGVISAAQLDSALQQQGRSGLRLGRLLLANGWLTPEALADAVAVQHQLPRMLRDTQPLRGLAASISPEVMRAHQVVPLAVGADNTLQVAVADRPSSDVAVAIHRISGYHVAYLVACDHEVEAWIDELAPQQSSPKSQP